MTPKNRSRKHGLLLGPSPKKRLRRSSLPSDEDDSNARYLESASTASQAPCSPAIKTLACPFYKYAPADHQACARLNLSKISYVKQHLLRRHMAPKFCPRCFETFTSHNEFEAHILQTIRCKERPGKRIYGITETKKEKLSQRSNQSLTDEGKWGEIWDIIFGKDQSRPASVYIDLDLPAEVNWLTDYMMSEVPSRLHIRDIIHNSNLSPERQSEEIADNVIYTLMETVQAWKNIWQEGRPHLKAV